LNFKNDDLKTSKVEMFGNLKNCSSLKMKGGIDNDLNLRLWN